MKKRKNSVGRIRSKQNANNSQSYVELEKRRMLAANLELVDAYLVDGNFNQITSPAHGEKIGIRAVWNTTDLPSNASYRIGFYVDGVELTSGNITAGAGQSQANGFIWNRTGWYATGQLQNVTVIADVLDTVSESSEFDNTLNFSFTSQTPDIPQKMIWPMASDPYSEIGVTNYVDVNPTSGIGDYAGNSSSYNGHNAFDSGPGYFQDMDAGFELFAAADGVVSFVDDGEFDRQTAWVSGAIANAVKIDHGNGWESFYWHMRRDSVKVTVGQVVSQGDVLGYMGSSGISSGLHVHFGLTHHGRTVEPMFAEADYFESPFGNAFDNQYVYKSVVSNYYISSHLSEGLSQVDTFSQQAGQTSAVLARFSGLQANDQLQYLWYRPNGTLYTTGTLTLSASYANSHWIFTRTLPNTPDLGTWRVDFRVNGVLLGDTTFEVTADGAPEMRIEDLAGRLIVDDRFTPLDFGEPNLGSTDPTQTFNVINHGTDLLTLGAIELPANYYLVEGLPASLAAGASDSFTVALDTATAGYQAGEVRIETNDADESIYNFSVEGFVNGSDQKLVLGISERRIAEGNTIVANVRRPGNPTGALTVSLSTNDLTEVTVPSTVTFADGEEYASFEIQTLGDDLLDGDQIAEIYASATGYAAATNTLEVLDSRIAIVGRFFAYDNSVFDGYSSGAGVSDDAAINFGKTPLFPGQTATFANYSSYFHGINSIVIDAEGLNDPNALAASDFTFKTGNGSTNADFSSLGFDPVVTVREGAGESGSDRITLTFGDGTIAKTWLQVKMLANSTTGLTNDDIFYFGNAIGETGNNSGNAIVNLADVGFTRENQSGFSTVDITSDVDFDRSGRVTLVDVGLARENQSGFSALNLITAPDGQSFTGFLASSGSGTDGRPLDNAAFFEFDKRQTDKPTEQRVDRWNRIDAEFGLFSSMTDQESKKLFGMINFVAKEPTSSLSYQDDSQTASTSTTKPRVDSVSNEFRKSIDAFSKTTVRAI